MITALVTTVLAANGFTPRLDFEAKRVTGAPSLQLGVLSEPLSGELSQSAKAWALARRTQLGLHPATTLAFETGFATRFGASLHYRQQLDGVDVYQAKLVITLDAQRRVVQISSSLVDAKPIRSAVLFDEAHALAVATVHTTTPVLRVDDPRRGVGAAKRFFFEVDGELRAGFLVHVASYDPTKNWYVGVDAVTGAALFAEDRALRAEFDANVYASSPGGLDAGVGATPTVVRPLTRADGGSYLAATCETLLADGGFEIVANDAGLLCGDQLTVLNCCTREGCQPDAGPKRLVGPTRIAVAGFSLELNVDMTICDRVNQATNQRPEGDFRYAPVDPPSNRAAVDLDDPANSDTFAQVHAFHHVNRVYDWVRGLSGNAAALFPQAQPAIAPFRMRDERRSPARRPAVLTNVVLPNFQAVMGIPACLPPQFGGTGMGACVINGFTRFDNAQFLPVEDFAQLPLPGLATGVDSLIIYQGNGADPAYDATVLWHEFGHGVIASTAGLSLSSVALDARSANNEGGALHEGLSDYIAAAFGQSPLMGPYFGPRAVAGAMMGIAQDGYLRSAANSQRCPEVLWGQVHQDGQHITGALWEGRLANQGSDQGATYDAAFYAMLVSLSPTANFSDVAQVMAQRVSTAFSPAAGQALAQIFMNRGVVGCSKTLDVTDATQPRPVFGIPGTMNSTNPGPFQFKLRVPNGAQTVRIRGAGGGGFGGGNMAMINVLTKTQPISFMRQGTAGLTHDADFSATITAGGNIDARAPVAVPCGANQEIYVALTGRATTLQNVTVTAEPLVNCMLPTDGGMPVDAGMPEVDAGVPADETKRLPAVAVVSQPTALTGCGCGASDGLVGVALAVLLFGLRRR